MKKRTMITGYAAALMVLAGLVFKLQHWPGASILIVSGSAIFSFGYGILLFLEKRKATEESLPKYIAIWVLLLMIVIPVSFAFKMQHWPGASVGIIASHLLLFLSIPVLIIYAIKTKDPLKKLNFHNEVIIIILLAAFSIFVWKMRINKTILETFIPLNQTVVSEMKYHEAKSNELFTTMESAVNASNAGKSFFEKAKEVKNACDSLSDLIISYEKEMVKLSGQENCNVDSLTLWAKDNVNFPAAFMIVAGNGEKLKNELISFKEKIDQRTNSRGKEVIALFFNTDDPKPVEGETMPRTWLSMKFQYVPMIAVLFELNQIRANIRLLEAETMIYLQAMVAKAVTNSTATANEEKKENKKEKK